MKFIQILFPFLLASSLPADQPKEIIKEQPLDIGTERIRFFDGSDLKGKLLKLDQRKTLFWKHESSYDPIGFNFKAIESLLLDRVSKEGKDKYPKHLLRIQLVNGDKLRCDFKSLNKEKLLLKTGISSEVAIPVTDLVKMEFLPETHEILFDSSEGLSDWKSSNRKSWTAEEGSMVSVFSGSTGTILPKKDALEVEFEAQWERSFYLALRFFSDSDGASYGNTGYHLSFSNNRLNLQANKRTKGRISRETIGSTMVSEITSSKKARFTIYAHRKRKEFIIRVNDREVARWKDPSEDFYPDGNGILFINQGGNSYMKLKEVTIAGWEGEFFPLKGKDKESGSKDGFAVFTNGDSTEASTIIGKDDSFSLQTKRGTFDVPLNRMRSLNFAGKMREEKNGTTSEQVFLKRSLGRLSFDLHSIKDETLIGSHPSFGPMAIPLNFVKRMTCNQNLKRVRLYLDKLALAKKALDDRQPGSAVSLLNQTEESFRGWYWGRLSLLAENMQSEEKLSFAPHPEKGLATASFAGDSETVLTVGKDGSYSLWEGHAELADGEFTQGSSFPVEIGRFSNEEQKVVVISRPFWLGQTEVTQEQFEQLMKKNPSNRKQANLPVEVSWFDAVAFCRKLNETESPPPGYEWRLPTEAEWEYACRAGSSGPFCKSEEGDISGNEPTYERHLGQFGWFGLNSGGESHEVRQKKPNDFGLYDMHGNVWEWCLDAVSRNKTSFMTDRISGAVDPYSEKGEWRALRGGNFEVPYSRCRSAYRGANAPSVTESDRGFRLALGPILGKELNATAEQFEDREIQKLSLLLKAIPKGSFLMGSPSSLTAPPAITDSFGDKLLTGSSGGILGSTDFSGRPVESLYDFNSSISALAACPDEPLVFLGCKNGKTYLFNHRDGKLIQSFDQHKFPISSVAFDSKGAHFASAGLDGKINLYRKKDFSLLWSFEGTVHGTNPDQLEFSKNSPQVMASGKGSPPVVIDVPTGKSVKALGKVIVNHVASHFHPNGNAVVSITENGLLVFTQIKSGIVYNLIRLNINSVQGFSFSKYGDRIIVFNDEGTCSIRGFKSKGTIIVQSPDKTKELAPDYYFALSRDNEPSVMNLSDYMKEEGVRYEAGKNPSGCAHSNDKKWFVTSLDGALRLWNCETDVWVTTIAEKLASPIVDCAFSPKDDYILLKLKSGHILAYPSRLDSNLTKPDFEENLPLSEWIGKKERKP